MTTEPTDEANPSDALPDEEPAAPARVRIVIAEDEAIIRLDLKETLEDMGYEVVGDVGTGEDALALIADVTPDLAILDIKMGPGLSGLDVARSLASDHACAVLILTAFSQSDLVEEAVDAGVMSYLVKPFQRSSLKPAIDVAFARFHEAEAVRQEVGSLEEQLEVRKLVDRAKGRLMDTYAMSEKDAFSFVQKAAMTQRTQMKAIATMILDGDLVPGETT